jgi:hypothetical protein
METRQKKKERKKGKEKRGGKKNNFIEIVSILFHDKLQFLYCYYSYFFLKELVVEKILTTTIVVLQVPIL